MLVVRLELEQYASLRLPGVHDILRSCYLYDEFWDTEPLILWLAESIIDLRKEIKDFWLFALT